MKLPARKQFGLVSGGLLLIPLLIAFQPIYASGGYATINGNWLISQAAAGATNGNAPQVVACGTFTLNVVSASGRNFAGTFTATQAYNPEQISLPSNEAVSGSWMAGSILGVPTLRVMFSGNSPVILGSFASPPTQPTPSTPDPSSHGCTGLSSGDSLFGFVQLPGQGTEGMFIYSTQSVSGFPLSS